MFNSVSNLDFTINISKIFKDIELHRTTKSYVKTGFDTFFIKQSLPKLHILR